MKRLLMMLLLLLFSVGLLVGAAKDEKSKKEQENQQTERGQMVLIGASQQKKYQGEPGDFIFYNADLQNVLINFARTYKLNIVLDPDIKGKVTCRLIQVPWDQALDVILRQHGLAMVHEGGIISVVDLFKKKKKHK